MGKQFNPIVFFDIAIGGTVRALTDLARSHVVAALLFDFA
jgi:hypothetical protein